MKTSDRADEKVNGIRELAIPAPNFQTMCFRIRGTSLYVQNKFSKKAKEMIMQKQEAGSTGAKGKKREKKDFNALYQGSIHATDDGWHGIPAPAFRNAMISACRIVGFKMTLAKLSVFVEADGFDKDDGTPLVKITKGAPYRKDDHVRLETGVVDIRTRAAWAPGWEADVRVRFDGDQFTAQDVMNLLMRVGMQVGVGEGRPDGRESCGMGWGMFEVLPDAVVQRKK